MNYIVMDLEWNQPMGAKRTVTSPYLLRGEIIQIGAVKLNDAFEITDTYKQMVAPKYYTRMHFSVAKLTHIQNADLKQGIPFRQACREFFAWCGKEFAFLTWGPDDIPMLKSNMLIHGFDPDRIPPCYNVQVLFARQIAKENRQFSLSAATEMVGETLEDAHDALNDAVSTALVCRHLNMAEGLEHYADGKMSFASAPEEDDPSIPRYSERREALIDPAVCVLPDPETGAPISCGRWVSQKNDRYISLAKGEDGKAYFVRVRFRKLPDGTFRANRSVYPLDDTLLALYQERAAACRSRSKRRRKRTAVAEVPAAATTDTE